MRVWVVIRNDCDIVGIFKSGEMADQAARLYRNEWVAAGTPIHDKYGPFEYHVEGWEVT